MWDFNTRLSSLTLVLFVILGCSKVNNSTTKIFGHAASGLQNPNAMYHDNSLEAIRYSTSLPGCSGVEVDVRMDTQGKLWLFHDNILDVESNLTGKVELTTTDNLTGGHYRTLHKEPLLRLDLAMTELAQSYTFLDLKLNGISKAQEVKTALLALNYDTTQFALIVSSWSYVEVFKHDFQVFLSVNEMTELSNEMLEIDSGIRGICIRSAQITREEINFLKSIHKEVICFEVRSPKGIKAALEKQPTYILSDDLKIALGLMF